MKYEIGFEEVKFTWRDELGGCYSYLGEIELEFGRLYCYMFGVIVYVKDDILVGCVLDLFILF